MCVQMARLFIKNITFLEKENKMLEASIFFFSKISQGKEVLDASENSKFFGKGLNVTYMNI